MEEIKSFAKKIKWDSIIIAILTIAIGILCVVLPSQSANILCVVFGSCLIFMGAVLFIRFFAFPSLLAEHTLILGIIMMSLGIFCLVYPSTLQSILTVLFGVYIVIDSASSLTDSIYCARSHVKGWWLLLILSLLTLALGVVVMFSTFDAVMIFAGVSLIFEGAKKLFITLTFSHKVKQAKKELQDIEYEVK